MKSYYVHQLLAFALSAGLLAVLARRFLPAAAAAATGLLFVFGPPIPSVVSELMTRHYIEGCAAALGATLFFIRYLERRRPIWLVLASGAWLLAAVCKEIFVPLPLVLAALPVASLRERLRALWPFGVGIPLYAVWRQTMVAGAFGGYDASSEKISAVGERLILVARQFVIAALAPNGRAGRVLAALVLVLACAAVVRRKTLPLVAALVLSVALPLLPVAERLEPRFGFLSWLLVAFLSGCAFARGLSSNGAFRIVGVTVLLGAFLLAVPTNRRVWAALQAQGARNRAEVEFFLERAAPATS